MVFFSLPFEYFFNFLIIALHSVESCEFINLFTNRCHFNKSLFIKITTLLYDNVHLLGINNDGMGVKPSAADYYTSMCGLRH